MAASVADIPAIDTPHVKRDDLEGLRQVASKARRLGFDGKMTFLHEQIEAINELFSPSPEAIETSRRVLQAFEDVTDDDGVIYVDGQFVDKPVAEAHRERIETARARRESEK